VYNGLGDQLAIARPMQTVMIKAESAFGPVIEKVVRRFGRNEEQSLILGFTLKQSMRA